MIITDTLYQYQDDLVIKSTSYGFGIVPVFVLEQYLQFESKINDHKYHILEITILFIKTFALKVIFPEQE